VNLVQKKEKFFVADKSLQKQYWQSNLMPAKITYETDKASLRKVPEEY